jgi:hypothetical protein
MRQHSRQLDDVDERTEENLPAKQEEQHEACGESGMEQIRRLLRESVRHRIKIEQNKKRINKIG